MKHQATGAEYGRCVAAGACLHSDGGGGDLPQTAVSWHDATACARWLSEEAGEIWRPPSDEEWQRAAAERFVDDAAGESADPAERPHS